ncbi:hypothetical protein RFI_23014 [Reticulomyxa filosa]|uniref:EF-hand domain-containing protein n=1 Tax=Reticulomyxa filosa TaxID=46433 RepID=X6MKH6_RETFI|nr:hypothetical protein RFI_23014 [Reticulomyxa filosa]|eukprot:ETO14354.1 hypothetical protein RFI_23014 [Reticulomyxa filosa]
MTQPFYVSRILCVIHKKYIYVYNIYTYVIYIYIHIFYIFRWVVMTVTFKIYDVNNDGYISNGDLFRILKIMVGDNLNDTQLQQLVDRTIFQADEDKDGKLSEEEFTKFIQGSEIESKLVIDLNNAHQQQ